MGAGGVGTLNLEYRTDRREESKVGLLELKGKWRCFWQDKVRI